MPRRFSDASHAERTYSGRAVDRALAVGQHLVGELGRDDDLVAMLAQRLADQLLVVADAVHIGGVEKVDAEFDRALQRRGGFVIVARTVELRHPHASESQFRYFESLAAEFSLLHNLYHLSVRLGCAVCSAMTYLMAEAFTNSKIIVARVCIGGLGIAM